MIDTQVVTLTSTTLSTATEAPLTVLRTSTGFSLKLDSSFEADTSRFSLTVSALLSEPLIPGGDVLEPLALAIPVLNRSSPTTVLNYTINSALIEAALSAIEVPVLGLYFTLSETQAGQDQITAAIDEVYFLPDLSVSLDARSGDPRWGDDLMARSELFAGLGSDPKIQITASARSNTPETASGSELLLTLPAEASRWDPTAQAYRIRGSALKAALEDLPRGLDEIVQLQVFADLDNDGKTGRVESATTYDMPQATVRISPESLAVQEGAVASFMLTSTGLPTGTTLEYRISGDEVTIGDFVNEPLTGTLSLGPDGQASLQLETADDLRVEGQEQARISLSGQSLLALLMISDPSKLRVGTDLPDSIRGTDLDDEIEGGGGNDTLLGGLGADRLDGGDGDDFIDPGTGADSITAGAGNDTVQVRGEQTVYGNRGNDQFVVSALENAIYGDAGIDTVIYPFPVSAASVQVIDVTNHFVRVSSANKSDELAAVERLNFSDFALAFDWGETRNVLDVTKILATVFGPNAVDNREYAGIGLYFLDQGFYNTASLMQLALEVALGSRISDRSAVVELLYENVIGVKPSPAEAAPFIEQLQNGTHTVGSLGLMAAEYNIMATKNIDLVGILEGGLRYLPIQ